MVNPEILDYVKKELARGVSEDKLRKVLMEYGWPEFEINEVFETVKESHEEPVEKVPEEIVEKKPEVKEKSEIREEVRPEERIEAKPKFSIEDIKRIVMNKFFIIAVAVLIIGIVSFFVIPLLFQDDVDEEFSEDAIEYAKRMCAQYCSSNLCGLYIDPKFTHPELEGKSCIDLGFSCKQPNGKPKCETEY